MIDATSTSTSCRAAFERYYFGDLPATVPAREIGSHDTYTHAAPQHAWTVWQRAWSSSANHQNQGSTT